MGPKCCQSCCSFPHNQRNNKTSILITLVVAATALLCTVLTFDPYGAFMGVGATGLLVAMTCIPISPAGFVVTSIMAWAAALMSAMNLVSIVLTTICDDAAGIDVTYWGEDDDNGDVDDWNTMNATYTVNNNSPDKSETDANANDDSLNGNGNSSGGDYTFFCTYQHFFLALTIVATVLWMVTGKSALDMSYQQVSSRNNNNNNRWNEIDEETVAMEEDEQDDNMTESCLMEQGEVSNNNQETVENEDNNNNNIAPVDNGNGDQNNDMRNGGVSSSRG